MIIRAPLIAEIVLRPSPVWEILDVNSLYHHVMTACVSELFSACRWKIVLLNAGDSGLVGCGRPRGWLRHRAQARLRSRISPTEPNA
jgi:hypothetical protein